MLFRIYTRIVNLLLILVLDRKSYTEDQLAIIDKGLKSSVRIAWLVDPDLSPEQMEQIYLALLNNFDKHQLSFMVGMSFSAEQMEQVRLGIENGLTEHQVSKFSFYDNVKTMEVIRKSIEAKVKRCR